MAVMVSRALPTVESADSRLCLRRSSQIRGVSCGNRMGLCCRQLVSELLLYSCLVPLIGPWADCCVIAGGEFSGAELGCGGRILEPRSVVEAGWCVRGPWRRAASGSRGLARGITRTRRARRTW